MNVLPLVFTLLLILSVVTIEKYERFKNAILVQNEYKIAMEQLDRKVYNQRQEALMKPKDKISYRQITFRPFIDKKMRDPKYIEKYNQFRQVTVSLIKVLYENAAFFKEAQKKRPHLIDNLLDAIQEASDKMPENSIKRIQDISRIQLEDEDLQYVFYRMLKGSIEKDTYKNTSILLNEEKTYLPFLTFVNFKGADGNYGSCNIQVGLAPQELLLAIYGNQELVEEIIQRRCELSRKRKGDNVDPSPQFKSEFEGKQQSGIIDILDYKLALTDKSNRD